MSTYLMDPVDFDAVQGLNDLEIDDLMDKSAVVTIDIDIDVIFRAVHSKQPPRGTMSEEQRRQRRRERRQTPTAKVKESDRRLKREEKKDMERQCWLRREQRCHDLVWLCLVHAQSTADQQLCRVLLRESYAAMARARELCPNAMREQLNAVQQQWEATEKCMVV